jgi:hypothetical protein
MKQMDEQLTALLEYTKFHIGVYITLSTGIIAAFANKDISRDYHQFVPWALGSLVCFILAGVFGGLVGSSIPDFTSIDDFKNAKLGPSWSKRMQVPAVKCIGREHAFFWLGCLIAFVGLLVVLAIGLEAPGN